MNKSRFFSEYLVKANVICAAVVNLTLQVHNLLVTYSQQEFWGMPEFCCFFQSNSVDLAQIKDIQLDTLMNAGRWIYLTSVKPDAVFTDNSIKKP